MGLSTSVERSFLSIGISVFAFFLLLAAVPSCDRIRPLPKRVECERKAGHVLKALDFVEVALAKKPKDKKLLKLRDGLEAEVVTFEWFSEPEGALAWVDSEDPAGSTPISIRVDPGRHTFHFTHDGYLPLARDENAVSGTRPKLTAVLEREVKEEPVPPEPEVAQQQPQPQPAPPEAVQEPAPRPKPVSAATREYSKAPLILGTAGIFVAIGGGVLILTSALSQTFDSGAQLRQYVGYGLAAAGAAAGIAALLWLLIDRRPGATER